jgi:hypothetical protein
VWLPESPLKVEERVDFSKDPTSWKIILKAITGDVVISGMVDFMYVVLSRVE